MVSVPIRGLFNLTLPRLRKTYYGETQEGFRPHQGII